VIEPVSIEEQSSPGGSRRRRRRKSVPTLVHKVYKQNLAFDDFDDYETGEAFLRLFFDLGDWNTRQLSHNITFVVFLVYKITGRKKLLSDGSSVIDNA